LFKVGVLENYFIVGRTFGDLIYSKKILVPSFAREGSRIGSGSYFNFKGAGFCIVSLWANIWIELTSDNLIWSFTL
jgi:hypothetical protein